MLTKASHDLHEGVPVSKDNEAIQETTPNGTKPSQLGRGLFWTFAGRFLVVDGGPYFTLFWLLVYVLLMLVVNNIISTWAYSHFQFNPLRRIDGTHTFDVAGRSKDLCCHLPERGEKPAAVA